ncbi:MAG: trigger factor [Bacteroidia bacterium]|nr:hypothetical protein [Bacteroidia bacterium]MDW8134218.1 trigger factor [Bacteroidia bacterium]
MEFHLARPYLLEGEMEIPPSYYVEPYKARLRALRRELVLPGFRPGQIPQDIIASKHGESLLAEILSHLLLQLLESNLNGRKLIGLPYYEREPAKIQPQPPFPTYHYRIKALVVPSEPLPLQHTQRIRYTYELRKEDLGLYQRLIRMAYGKATPLTTLPSTLPLSQEILVRFQIKFESHPEPIRLSWNSPVQTFPWSYLAGRKVGETFSLPLQAIQPYNDMLKALLPTFSLLTAPDEVEATLLSANLIEPLSLEELEERLDFPKDEAEKNQMWESLLEKHIRYLLDNLNTQIHQLYFLHAAEVTIPPEIAQINYLIYLYNHQKNANGRVLSYEDLRTKLAWQVFFASYAYNEPSLAVSNEELEEEIWDKLKSLPTLSTETQTFLQELQKEEERKKELIQSLVKQEGESIRRAMQYKRFEAWLEEQFGAPAHQNISREVLFLQLI